MKDEQPPSEEAIPAEDMAPSPPILAEEVSRRGFLSLVSVAMAGVAGAAVGVPVLAYIITPLHSNAVTLIWSYYDGSINFNGALPVSDALFRTPLATNATERLS